MTTLASAAANPVQRGAEFAGAELSLRAICLPITSSTDVFLTRHPPDFGVAER